MTGGGEQVELPARLLARLRTAGDPLSLEAAAFIEGAVAAMGVSARRKARSEARRQAREAREAEEERAGRYHARFTREALVILKGEARKHDMPLEVYRGKRRGQFRWKGVYDCWGLAQIYGVSHADLSRFLRMDPTTVRVIVKRMKAAGQISKTRLASDPGSALPGSSHHGVSTSESNIDA